MDSVPCFVCGADLPIEYDIDGPQPTRGVTLSTRGHSGSRFYESVGRDVLQLCICDACMMDGRESLQTYDEFEPIQCEGIEVGRVYLTRELREWDGRVDDTVRLVETDDLGDMLDDARRVDWHEAAMDVARAHRKGRALAERAAQGRDEAPDDQPEPAKRTRTRPPRRRTDRVDEGHDEQVVPVAPAPAASIATPAPPTQPSRTPPVVVTIPVVPKPGPPRYDPIADATDREERVEARRQAMRERNTSSAALNLHAPGRVTSTSMSMSDEEVDQGDD